MRPPPPQRRFPKAFPSDQCLDPNLVALRGLALPESGAGDGNRTHGSSLGSLGITIIRRPRRCLILVAFWKIRQPLPIEGKFAGAMGCPATDGRPCSPWRPAGAAASMNER